MFYTTKTNSHTFNTSNILLFHTSNTVLIQLYSTHKHKYVYFYLHVYHLF